MKQATKPQKRLDSASGASTKAKVRAKAENARAAKFVGYWRLYAYSSRDAGGLSMYRLYEGGEFLAAHVGRLVARVEQLEGEVKRLRRVKR